MSGSPTDTYTTHLQPKESFAGADYIHNFNHRSDWSSLWCFEQKPQIGFRFQALKGILVKPTRRLLLLSSVACASDSKAAI